MRSRVWMVMISILMTHTVVTADYQDIPIWTGTGNQTMPDIDGDRVVWQDSDNCIYYKVFGDPNDPNVIAGPGQQQNPALSGDVVIWYDVHTAGITQKDIYGYDFQNESNLFLISNDGKTQKNPAISGNDVVWQDLTNGNYDIVAYDLSSGTAQFISTDSAHQLNPAIGDGYAVWQDGRDDGYYEYDIYMCDLMAGAPFSDQPVSPSGGDQWYPAVSGHLVAWEELGSGSATIVVYDILQGQRIWEHTVTTSINAYCDIDHDPVSGQRTVVWQQGTNTNSDIYACDLNTGVAVGVATGVENDQRPAISGRRIVWQRNGTDIYGAEIPIPTVIAVDSPVAAQMLLAGTQGDITWTLDSGTAPAYIDLEYSVNNGAEKIPMAQDIPFDDGLYSWTVPADVDSQQCIIFITDADDPSAGGLSGMFTIFQCDPALTADVTGDCFVGIEDIAELAAQWLLCGNPHDPAWCTD